MDSKFIEFAESVANSYKRPVSTNKIEAAAKKLGFATQGYCVEEGLVLRKIIKCPIESSHWLKVTAPGSEGMEITPPVHVARGYTVLNSGVKIWFRLHHAGMMGVVHPEETALLRELLGTEYSDEGKVIPYPFSAIEMPIPGWVGVDNPCGCGADLYAPIVSIRDAREMAARFVSKLQEQGLYETHSPAGGVQMPSPEWEEGKPLSIGDAREKAEKFVALLKEQGLYQE